MIRFRNGFVAIVLSLIICIISNNTICAASSDYGDGYFIINGEQMIDVYEDYENPETGEYIHWTTNTNARGVVVKTFSFKIRHSVTSSKFTVGSTSVYVSSDAHVEDISGNYQSGYSGHAYQISINGIYSRNLYFSINGTESGTITGLSNGNQYSVTIINNDYLSDRYYLVGSGSIKNN